MNDPVILMAMCAVVVAHHNAVRLQSLICMALGAYLLLDVASSPRCIPYLPRRSPKNYVNARSRHWFETIVGDADKMDENHYMSFFRMSR